MKFLSDTTQTSYSTLLQKIIDSQWGLLRNNTFVKKEIKDKAYWYCQYLDLDGSRKQRYFGPDNEKTQSLVTKMAGLESDNKSLMDDRKRLVAMIAAGGGNIEKGRVGKIIEKLSDAGVFESGGLLIGSYAFSTYGNMLGVVFDESMRRTEDMDVAYDRSIDIGFVRDLRDDITQSAPEMVEPKQLLPFVPPYEMVAPDGFKLEFLTSTLTSGDKGTVPIERFKVNALMLEFLDYILEDSADSIVLYGAGIKVKVPDPARYAIHKLAISTLRPHVKPEKSRKDLAQAEALIGYFLEENPGALLLALDALKSRDDMLINFVEKGIKTIKNNDIKNAFLKECWNDLNRKITFKI